MKQLNNNQRLRSPLQNPKLWPFLTADPPMLILWPSSNSTSKEAEISSTVEVGRRRASERDSRKSWRRTKPPLTTILPKTKEPRRTSLILNRNRSADNLQTSNFFKFSTKIQKEMKQIDRPWRLLEDSRMIKIKSSSQVDPLLKKIYLSYLLRYNFYCRKWQKRTRPYHLSSFSFFWLSPPPPSNSRNPVAALGGRFNAGAPCWPMPISQSEGPWSTSGARTPSKRYKNPCSSTWVGSATSTCSYTTYSTCWSS